MTYPEFSHTTLQILYAPGVYELVCQATQNVYYGETISLGERFGRHYRALETQQHHESALLQHHWNIYGPSAFVFRVLDWGDAWTSRQARRQQETRYIQQAGDRAYNIVTTPRYRISCQIHEHVYPTLEAAALAQGVSLSTLRRRLRSAEYPNYREIEKISTCQPFQLHGIWYTSQQHAMDVLGISRSTLYRYRQQEQKSASNDYPERE
jgi:hypothetical protein